MYLILAAAGYALFGAALWWLVPIAFPAFQITYFQAVAMAGLIGLLLAVRALSKA